MRARLSIVIPTWNAEPALASCFTALMEGLDAGLIREVIVSDAGSDDATGAVAQAWGACVIDGPSGRGGQLRRGVARARGEWLLILHADTALQPGWSEIARRHIEGDDRAGWFRLAFDQRGIAPATVAGWANLRSTLGLPYGDQGLLVSRALYDEIGGYPDQPLMEDVALAGKLRGRLVALDAFAVTSAEKYRAQGWLRRGGRNLWTLVRYFAGTSPDRLADAYRR